MSVRSEKKYPMMTNSPSFSKTPTEINRIDQAATKLLNGMGKGKARKIPRKKKKSLAKGTVQDHWICH